MPRLPQLLSFPSWIFRSGEILGRLSRVAIPSRIGIALWISILSATTLANSATPAISAGVDHSIALKSDGTVVGWGSDALGGLGSGRLLSSTTPVLVGGASAITAVSSGLNFVVALKSNGTVWAWGDNRSGQLGDGTTSNLSVPVQVAGLSAVTAVSAGGIHSFALKQDGSVWGWGAGPLGDGSNSTRLHPTQVSGLTGVARISAGQFHAVAVPPHTRPKARMPDPKPWQMRPRARALPEGLVR